jgi:predicted RNase H-like HicB family nuclease
MSQGGTIDELVSNVREAYHLMTEDEPLPGSPLAD